jgi:LysM repeat protein
MSMKWRHWAILIILVLLNYIIFSTAFTQLAKQRSPQPRPARTLPPTFESVEPTPMAWIVLPTNTPLPTRSPVTATPTATVPVPSEIAPTNQVTAAGENPATAVPSSATAVVPTDPPATATAAPLTAAPAADTTIHKIRRGETLSEIASRYNVTVQEIVQANGLEDPNRIVTGQSLVIPGSDSVPAGAQPASPPPATSGPTNTPRPRPPTATPMPKPPTATPRPASNFQFTGQVLWEPLVAANCAGPAITKRSVIRDTNGNPVNGARVEVDCYGNRWTSHPSGNPGEYDPGHYDFAFGQGTPQAWTCTARVVDVNGQPVASSEVVTIQFDTNDCSPHGNGHQVATVNWTKHW